MLHAPWLEVSERRDRYETRADSAAGAEGSCSWAAHQVSPYELANIIINVHARIVAVASELEEDGVELGFNNRRRSSAMLFVMKSPVMQ